MPHRHRRHRRHLTLAFATALAFVLVPSSAAFAAAQFSLSTSASPGSGNVFASVFGTPAEVPGPMRLVVRRGGTVVVDKLGEPGSGFSFVEADVALSAGDVIELYNPATAGAPSKTLQYTGRPSLESCPLGQRILTGRVDPGTQVERVGAFRPSAGSGDPARSNPAGVTHSGDGYVATFRDTLEAGDVVFVSGRRQQVDSTFAYQHSADALAGACGAGGGGGGGGGGTTTNPGPTTTNPGPPTTTITPRNGLVEPLDKSDVKQGSDPALVRVTRSAASAIACAGTVAAQTIRRFGRQSALASAQRKKRLTLATKRFSVAPGRTKVVRLKLKKPALRLLKRQRRLKVRVTVATKDAAGKRLVITRTVTLKHKRKKRRA